MTPTKTISKGKLLHVEDHGSSGERKGITEVAFQLLLKPDFNIFKGISKAQKQLMVVEQQQVIA